MQVLTSAGAMNEKARGLRAERKRLGLVPTMGMFHEGHLSLMRRARKENDVLTVSLFVNPAQFGPGEDFESYPRDQEADLRKAEEEGVDLVFMPGVEEIYPPGDRTFIEVEGLSDVLCGERRPGHFRGVTTVVAKLFAVCLPHRAYFGKKDFQQWVIIRRMVSDLRMDVEVVGCPTVRERNGLAHSSRNFYLDDDDRARAIGLRRALQAVSEDFREGRKDPPALIGIASKVLEAHGLRRDYLVIVHPETLVSLDEITGPAVVLGAVWCGKARLIDNLELD
ncbi:MAG: pantoate--beta-alanine ligase [Nitrospinota bacterium]|jgi:pantoate--beta-alanine ligase|nr:pantoate--beta-alanine ligase [Nitrospinota bacterium]MDP6483887.1 pantoate--beta-alanine ligase [Nitrospinota bacterium]